MSDDLSISIDGLRPLLEWVGGQRAAWSADTMERAHQLVAERRWDLREAADDYYAGIGLHPRLDNDPRLRARAGWIPETPISLIDVDARLGWCCASAEQRLADSRLRRRLCLFPAVNVAPSARHGAARAGRGHESSTHEARSGPLRIHYSKVLQHPLVGPPPVLYDGASYRIMSVGDGPPGEAPTLTFTSGSYFEALDTCEVNGFLLALHETRGRPSVRRLLPFRRHKLPLCGEPPRLLDLGSRHALIGVNCLVLARELVDGAPRWRMFMHDRTQKVAEARCSIHVVPAGTFQPDREDTAPEDHFSVVRTVLREFLEELQGWKALGHPETSPVDFLADRRGQQLSSLVATRRVPLWFLGLAVDPISTKPELLCAMVLDGTDDAVRPLIESIGASNIEGRVLPKPFKSSVIESLLENEKRLLPAAAGCLRLAERHRTFLTSRVPGA